jgi:predicted transposase/invertase (TIGR01784 family)
MNSLNIRDFSELLPFKNDYVFKSMLTKPDSALFRNAMLSAFTGLNIVSSDVVENEPALDISVLEKQIRFDVNCITDDGTKIDIEMQAHSMKNDNLSNGQKNLCVRSLYYVGKLFVGQDAAYYSKLNKAIQIMVCDYPVFPDDKFIHKFFYRDGDLVLCDYCSIIYVELPKLADIYTKSVDDMTDDERWAVFVEYVNDKKFSEKAEEFTSREEFKMAMEMLSNISQNDRERASYISHLKYKMDTAQQMHDSYEEGFIKNAIRNAKNALEIGLPLEQIVKITELPLSEIKKLQAEL